MAASSSVVGSGARSLPRWTSATAVRRQARAAVTVGKVRYSFLPSRALKTHASKDGEQEHEAPSWDPHARV